VVPVLMGLMALACEPLCVCIYGSAVPGSAHTIDCVTSLIIDVHQRVRMHVRASY